MSGDLELSREPGTSWHFTAKEVAQAIGDAEPISEHTESARIDWLARLAELLCELRGAKA